MEITIETLPEYDNIEHALSFEETGVDQSKYIKQALKLLEQGDQWVWCTVKVACVVNDIELGCSFLGQGSYIHEEDFRLSGEFEWMKEEAIDQARSSLLIINKELC